MFIKKSLQLYLFILLATLCSRQARAQYVADRLAIHFSNPIGLVEKGGLKFEYRLSLQNAVLATYDRFWYFFPGYRVGLEYHRYHETWGNDENFIYGKAGIGYAEYEPHNLYSGWEKEYLEPGKYLYLEGGVGRRYHWGPFFIEINAGLKLAQLIDKPKGEYNQNLFYSVGPGSLIDCNLHFGFQFLGHKGSVSHITGHQNWRRLNY